MTNLRKILHCGFGLLLLFLSSFVSAGIDFKNVSFDEAKVLAVQENKLVFVDVYTDWCGPCKRMSKNVFTDSDLGSFMNEHFISIQIDAESKSGKEYSSIYSVKSFPTVMYFNKRGAMIRKVIGFQSIENLITLASEAIRPESTKLFKLQTEYNNGDRNSTFIVDYIKELKANGINYSTVARSYVYNNGIDLENADDFQILVDAKLGLDNSYVMEVLNAIEQYRTGKRLLVKQLVTNAVLSIYADSREKRDFGIIEPHLILFVHVLKIAVDETINQENIMDKLGEMYRPDQEWVN